MREVLSGCAVRAAIQMEQVGWQPIETAPKDGTLLLLIVDYSDGDGALENESPARTVGFNNFDHDGEDCWQLAGWCWSHDHFTEGHGRPIKWQPFPSQ